MKFTAPAVRSPTMPTRTAPAAAKSSAVAPRLPKATRRRVQRHRPRVSRLLAWLLAAWLGPMGLSLAQVAPGTLPSGGQVVVGSGVLQHNPNLLVIQQNSQKLGLDWQSFNIGSAATVEFRQPDAGSVALNRVLGNSGTEIYGQLRANGQVFLTNPNGVLFAPGAKVDVGGLVASTLDLSQQDFADGRYVFNHTGGRGAVVNQGSLTASAGGYLVLFGNQVSNQGDIAVDAGSVVLASGRAATVSISGSGLLSAVVTPGALDGRVDNGGRISADGGVVTLTAKSAQDIAASLVNNSGIVRANTLVEQAGEIWITGDRVASSGTLSVAAPGSGDAGRVVVKGDLKSGSLQLDGRIDATAAQGRGGSVETSAAHVAIARETRVDSRGGAATGTWLIDPTDFTIAAGGGALSTSGIGADTLATNLATNNITLSTDAGGSEPGDIHVNAAVSWSANTSLTLQATRDINLNASLTATGAGAGLVLTTGTGRFFNVNTTDNDRPTVTLSGVNATLSINNLAYTLVRDLAGLQAINNGLTGRYALVADIDASSTAANGFVPIGNESSASVTNTGAFSGIFDGMGHRISDLTVSRPTSNATGLFASTNGATLRNFELFGGSVSGSQFVGAVAGYTRGTTLLHNIRSSAGVNAIDDGSAGVWAGGLVGKVEGASAVGVLRSAATGTVSGTSNTSAAYVGGLVGDMDSGQLANVSASGNVTVALATGSNDATHHAGGLVGHFSGTNITTAAATGTVMGGRESGGLIGRYQPTGSGTLTLATASGNVSGTGDVGGLVGYASGTGAITSSSATGSVSTSTPESQSFHAGGAVGRYSMSLAPSALSAAGNVSGGNTTGGVVGWIESNVALVTGSLVSAAPAGNPAPVKTVTGPRWVGGLIGYSDSTSTFSGLSAEAVVTATGSQGSVGGLIGRSNGALNSSSSSGSVSGPGDIGGLVGRAQGAGGMNAVSSASNVTSTGTGAAAGGLVGSYTNSGNISNASASGAVQGPSGSGGITGGLIGSFSSAGSMTTVSTATTSTVTGGGDVGGLVGQATGSGSAAISGATVRGAVTGAANTGYVGGLVGQFGLPGGWSNVTVEGAVAGGNMSGGLAGYYSSASAVTNGTYTPASITGGTWVGGIVGYMASAAAITGAAANNPWVIGTNVTATAGGGGAGGLAGRTAGAVSNISTTGTVSGTDDSGGVVGRAEGSGGLSSLRASGNVTSSAGAASVGGVVGYLTNSGGLNAATASGQVSGGRYTGGVVGQYSTNGNLQTLRGEGNVSGTGDVGGVVGYASGSGTLSDADALGSVTSSATGTYSVGGAVGYFAMSGGLSDITAAGNVSGGAQTGGVVGYYTPTTAIAAGALSYVNSASRSVTGTTWVGGLIGYSNAASIGAHSVAATVTNTGTYGGAGGLAGRTGGSLVNSSASGAVVSASAAGGLVGQADGTATFTDVSASGAVQGRTEVGGLVGSFASSATLLRATATGSVFTNSTGGGLVGYHYGGAITDSSASGSVIGVSDSTVYLGGLVGQFGLNCYYCTLSESYVISGSQASGTVRADASGSYTGGLVGLVYSGIINNSNASGAVTSRDTISSNSNEYTGGLVGYFGIYNDRGRISGSNATGAVNGGYYTGGLVGLFSGGAVSNSTASGAVSNGRETGGLIGYAVLYGPMSNVSASGAVTSSDTNGGGAAGGLLGRAYLYGIGDETSGGSITNASASGAVTVARTSGEVGGLIGYVASSNNTAVGPINDSRASGNVSGGSSTGGLIGRFDNSGGYSAVLNSNATGSVTGNNTAGGLIGGYSRSTTSGRADDITNSYATGRVSGNTFLGGLVGDFNGRFGIVGSYATGDVVARDVTGTKYMGGLVGNYFGRHASTSVVSAITTSYATGRVSLGANPTLTGFTDVYAGGLVGYLNGSVAVANGIVDAYATGAVSLTSTLGRLYAGGLVGYAVNGQGGLRSHASGAVSATGGNSRAVGGLLAGRSTTTAVFTDSHWNSTTTGQASSLGGGTARTTAEMQQAGSFTGWNLATTGVGGTVWRIYDGYTAPLLSRFLTPRTLSLADASKAYDGTRSFGNATLTATNGSINFPDRIFVATPSADVGSYSIAAAGVYSVQNGYDLTVTGSATLSVTPRPLTLAGLVADKVYDGTRTATLLGTAQPTGVVAGEALTVNIAGATAVFDTKNVGQTKAVTITGLSLADGPNPQNGKASNYALANSTSSTANVTPATLNAGGFTATNRAYDGSTTVAVSAAGGTVSGIFGNDDVSVNLAGVSSGNVADKNVGTAKPVTVLGAVLSGADAGNYVIGGINSTTVDITPRVLTINGLVATDRVYNQGLSVSVPIANGVISGAVQGDVLQLRNISVTGTMADRHAGTGKTVTVPGSSLQLRGPDATNYTVAEASSTVNIARATVSFYADYFGTNNDKVYDGSDAATAVTPFAYTYVTGYLFAGTTTSGIDNLTLSYDAPRYSDKNVAYANGAVTTKTITAANAVLGGTDAGNYILDNSSATTSGRITPRSLAVSGVSASNRAYDGSVNVNVNVAGATVDTSTVVPGDTVTVTVPGSGTVVGTMLTKNAGTAKPVTVPGFSLGGSDAGNYSLSGSAGVTVDITPKQLTAVYTAVDKVYDGNAYADINVVSADTVAGDQVLFRADTASYGCFGCYSFFVTDTSTPNSYTLSRNAGAGKRVVVTANSMYGADAANYTLLNPTATVTASITPKGITPVFTGVNRVYDGTTAATVTVNTSASGIVSGDAVSLARTATFADRNAGTGKTITITDIAFTGAAAANYTLTTNTATTTANITPKALGVAGVTATDRSYDGSTTVALTVGALGASGLVGSDVVTVNAPGGGLGTGTVATKSAGLNKGVTVAGLTLSGSDAGNYTIDGSQGVTVNITPRPLTVAYTGQTREYNGGVSAGVTASSADIVAGDVLSFTQNAIFSGLDGRNVGSNKPISVTSIVPGGADSVNYALQNTTATATGGITPKAITVLYTGLSRVYNGLADVSANVEGFSFGRIDGDQISFTQTATFTGNGAAGTGKAVNVSNIALAGPQGANYSLINTTATTTASITPLQLGVTGVVAANRVYDGTTVVQLSTLGATVLPSGVLAGDDVSVVLPTGGISTGTVATKDAGNNKAVSITGLTLTGASAANYRVGGNGLTVNITPRALTATYTAANRVYDSTTLASISATSGDILPADVGALGISASGLFSGGKNVGVNKSVAVSGGFLTGAERNNYSLVNATGLTTANITPRDLTAVYVGGTRVYDGSVNAPVVASGTGLLAGDAVSFAQSAVFTGTGAKNVGSGKAIAISGISLNGADASNYQLTNTAASATGGNGGSITPKSISIDGITGASATNRVYDGSTNVEVVVSTSGSISPSSADIVAGDAVTINLPSGGITSGTMANKNAGSNKAVVVNGLTLSGADAGNYLVAATTGITVNIARRALTAAYDGVNRAYDGSTAATATGSSPDVLGGDLVNISATGVFTGIGARNVGSNKPISLLSGSLTGADAANYTLVNTTGNTTANITPKLVAPSYTGLDRVYDGTTNALVAASTASIIAGDAVQFGQTAVFTGNKNVGTNKAIAVSGITLSGSDAGNYALTTTSAATSGNITPRPLRIDGLTGVAATDRVYDGSRIVSVVVSASGPIAPNPQDLIAGDVVTVNAPSTGITTGTMLDKNAGTAKPVAVAGLDLAGADAANYSITATSGVTVNIAPRPLTALYTAAAREYDGSTSASIIGSSADIVAGDVLSITGSGVFSGVGGRNVGTGKTIAITSVVFGGADMANYSLLNPTGTATGTITPRALNVSYLGGSRVYDGTLSAPVTGTVDRFVAGDNVSLVQTAVFTGAGAKNAGANKAVAISAIGLAGTDAANYSVNVSTASTTATVTPRPLRIEGFTGVVATDRVYDGTTAVAVTATGSGSIAANPADLIAGDDVGVVAPATGSTAGVVADKNVGNNKPVTVSGITLSGADAGNYQVAAAAGVTVNITPKPLSAVYAGLNRVYDGTANVAITGSSADIVSGDLVTITGSGLFTGADAKNVGTGKAISVTGGALASVDAPNYTLLNASGTATANVTPKTLVASYTGGTRVYDGSNAAPVTGVLDGLVAGDNLSFGQTAVFTGSGARNVGDGKAVLVSGITLSGSDAVNYSLLADTVSTVATITPRRLNIAGLSGLQAVDRVYDGTRAVELTGSLVVATANLDLIAGDDVTLNLPGGSVSAGTMVDKNVGTAKAVVVAGLSLSGNDATNYAIVGTAGLTVNITPRPVVLLGVSALDRVYDGTTTVAVNSAGGSLSGVLAGDDLQLRSSGVTGTTADKNAGNGKAVTVSGLSFEGADLGNYTVAAAGSGLLVNITPRALLASAVAADKVYDGSANATVTLGSNAIPGDSLSLAAASARFASANAGNNLVVTVSGLALGGADAGNYSFTTGTLTTSASIQRRPLTVAANTLSKIYGEALSLSSSNFSVDGLVQGESLGTAQLASAGTAATAAVGSYVLTIGGAGGGSYNPDNYVLSYVNGSLSVAPRPLTIAANSVVRFADQANPTSFGYSTSVGGLSNGDSLASVLVSAPAASISAPGVSVFDLQPTGAVFASGTASNYAITYGRGVLLVLPTPPRVDDVNAGGEVTGNTGFAVQVDPAEVERALGALTRNANVVAQAPADSSAPATPEPLPSREATTAAVAVLLAADGGRITLPDLQRLPLISFDPALLRRLLGGAASAAPAPAAAPGASRPAP